MSAKRPKKKKLSKRVSASLTRWLKKQNPAFKRASGIAVRKNKNRSITITPVAIGKRGKRRNVAQGFYDQTGFHPIRKSKDYDPDRAGDEY